MEPLHSPEPSKPLEAQMLLAFSFGIIFISILLVIAFVTPNPTDFQIFVYRVVMSLAAGGIGAIIPGFLLVQVSTIVRAGGAIACFALVYLVNPPSLASQKMQNQVYLDLMQRGEAALASGNTTLAKQMFASASALLPDAYLPILRLGTAHFESGNFETALEFYDKAYAKSDPKDASILFGSALCHEALNNLSEALKTLIILDEKLPKSSELYKDVRFSIGQIRLKMWQGNPSNDALYSQSANDFKVFLQLQGYPPHWAHYHLACLDATRASVKAKSGDEGVEKLNKNAIAQLRETVNGVKTYKSRKSEMHQKMLTELLKGGEIGFWPPGNPVICPPLQALSRQL